MCPALIGSADERLIRLEARPRPGRPAAMPASRDRASVWRRWLAVGAILGAAMPCSAQPREQPLAALAWLAGCWASVNGEAGSGEQWMPPAGGTMFGVGRTVKRGATVEHEFLQIQLNREGTLVYIASPSGQRPTTFTATSVSESSVTFENPQHDFPQRVIYRLIDGDRLAARIEGVQEGAPRSVDFPLQRTPCGAQGRLAGAR
jgi:hypothetical protein